MGGTRALNLTTGEIFAEKVRVAGNWIQRLRGLIGREALEEGEGLLIPKCSSVHTFFMKFPIDILFLDRDRRVTGTVSRLIPGRFALGPWSTRSVLELESGTLETVPCRPGDHISFVQ